ncbi:unnamed protein product [Paramecium primaurelia]|uniref:Protein kinase domain-containing protein n=1 Tax=Paramecium primaurelia TaxID=5886 RepID=A0A8S1P7I5_PARPR|nr:unnamed protein product [Paramecium primaurelia]
MSILINSIEYTNVQSIQNGQLGNVYFAKLKNEEVVIKELSLKEQEIKILENLMSKPPNNFVKIIDCDRKSYIVMEKGDGTLTDLLQSQDFKQLNFLQKIKLFQQIVNGIYELHSRNIIHRDLKPDNIIYFKQKQKIILKLIDTGQMNQLNDKVQFLTDIVGTENYRAPEYYLQNIKYNEKVDIWGLGLIFYHMITDQILIQKRRQIRDQQYLIQKIESNQISNENIQELLLKMLEQSYHLRWSAKQIKLELQRIIENIELKEELQILRKQFEVFENKYISIMDTNQSLQNQIQNSNQKISYLDQQLQESNQKYNNQIETIKKNQTQIQIVQEINSNYKFQINQLEQQCEQLKIEQDQYKNQILFLQQEKIKYLEQNQINQNFNNKNKIDQSIQSDQISLKHKKFILFGLPGAGKTWIFNKLQGSNQKYQNKSTIDFLEQFINDHNITIVDSPVFLDQQSYDEREVTYNTYNSYFLKNQIDDIVLIVQYQRTDLMKSQIKHCLKYFKNITAVIVTKFIDSEIITQNQKEQLRNQFQFCHSIIYFTNKDSSQTELLDIFYQIRISQNQKQTNFKEIFTKYVN